MPATSPPPTFCAAPPAAAAHSLSEDMVISRQIMMVVGRIICCWVTGAGGLAARRMSAVATLREGAATPTRMRHRPNQLTKVENQVHASVKDTDSCSVGHLAMARWISVHTHVTCAQMGHPLSCWSISHDLVGHRVQEGAKDGRNLQLRGNTRPKRKLYVCSNGAFPSTACILHA